MKIIVLSVGRTQAGYLREGVEEYVRRANRYMPVEMREIADAVRRGAKMTEQQQKEAEGSRLLAQVAPGDRLVLLDERGERLTSRQFSERLMRHATDGSLRGNLVFAIGGPYGFSQAVYDRADARLQLSSMTFTHEMVRLFFAEQLYRAMTIARGEPYHHD